MTVQKAAFLALKEILQLKHAYDEQLVTAVDLVYRAHNVTPEPADRDRAISLVKIAIANIQKDQHATSST